MTHSQRTYAGVPGDQRDEGRRRRLMEAALDRFATDGYPASSVESVCAAAGVSTRNFYDHFANREALLIAVYDEAIGEARGAVASALAQVPSGATAADYARAGLDAFTARLVEDPRRARVAFVEVVGASSVVEEHRRAGMRAFAEVLGTTAERLMAGGQIEPRSTVELDVQISILVGGVREALGDWLAQDAAARPPLAAVVDALVATVERAVR